MWQVDWTINKGLWREDGGSLRGIFSIKCPTQIRPSEWGEALKNISFKESLIGFLIETWKDDSCAKFLKNRTLSANYNNCCYKYCAENIEWQYHGRKNNFLVLTRKQTIECIFISLMLYQETQLLCKLMTPTPWWLLWVKNTFPIFWKIDWKQECKVKTTYDL